MRKSSLISLVIILIIGSVGGLSPACTAPPSPEPIPLSDYFTDLPMARVYNLDDDVVILGLPPGSSQTIYLTGDFVPVFWSSNISDVIWFQACAQNFTSTPLYVPELGANRTLRVRGYSYPSYGSIDLYSGEVFWEIYHLVEIEDVVSFPMNFTLGGYFSVTETDNGLVGSISATGSGTVPEDIPFLGGVTFTFSPGGGSDRKPPEEAPPDQTTLSDHLGKVTDMLAETAAEASEAGKVAKKVIEGVLSLIKLSKFTEDDALQLLTQFAKLVSAIAKDSEQDVVEALKFLQMLYDKLGASYPPGIVPAAFELIDILDEKMGKNADKIRVKLWDYIDKARK